MTDGTEKTLSELAERDRRDPKFHSLVDTLVSYMMGNKVAPDEMRDAAFVASIKFMHLNPIRDICYRNDEYHVRRRFDPEEFSNDD